MKAAVARFEALSRRTGLIGALLSHTYIPPVKFSRYLDIRSFLDEAKPLKALSSNPSISTLERLEKQRLLIPRLRLHYPDPIERRWWAKNHVNYDVGGEQEPDGPRWDAACSLEKARQARRWHEYPRTAPHALDDPEPEWMQFIEDPSTLPFTHWNDYRVDVSAKNAKPLYTGETVVTYYSTWQLLQYAEVAEMGVLSHMNLLDAKGFPSREEVAAAPRSLSYRPMHAMQGFVEHRAALDAVVWYAEETRLAFDFATRGDHRRRLLTAEETENVNASRAWAAEATLKRHGVTPVDLLAAIKFLCWQWTQWTHQGRPLIADAYKGVAAVAIRLACIVTGKTADEYRPLVGQAGGYFKPIMDVIWPDWRVEQREYTRRILVSYGRPDVILKADFNEELVDRFLAFVESHQLHGFYWRMESFHRHSFEGNDYSLEGLKGDVQGMAVTVEHIAAAIADDLGLPGSKLQLREKFKTLWAKDLAVSKLLKTNAFIKIGEDKGIDLDFFKANDALGGAEQKAADLVIAFAIRGGAHRVISENNSLNLELMILILLRAIVRTFDEATKAFPKPPA